MGNHTLHLIETELLAARSDFARRQTQAGIGLEQLLGNNPSGTGLGDLLLFVVDGSILGLEFLDESVDVLVLLLLFTDGSFVVMALLYATVSILLLLFLQRNRVSASRRAVVRGADEPMREQKNGQMALTMCSPGRLVPRWFGGTAPVPVGCDDV